MALSRPGAGFDSPEGNIFLLTVFSFSSFGFQFFHSNNHDPRRNEDWNVSLMTGRVLMTTFLMLKPMIWNVIYFSGLCQLLLVPAAAIPNTDCDSLLNLQTHEEKIYSQNGEDGVLLAILNIITVKYRSFVEFGVEDGSECNTRILWENFGFNGLMFDGGNENAVINLWQEFITERNVLEVFNKYNIQKNFDVLSIDVDMFDYWILARLLGDGQYKPRIIIVETNPTLCLNKGGIGSDRMKDYSVVNAMPLTVVHPNMTSQQVWDLSRYAGANPKSFQLLGKEYGYEMLYCERCGVNCFLVLRSELPENCRKGFPLPTIPYPCFGTARTGLAYPGHEVDPQERSAVKVSPDLIKKMKIGNLSVVDIESSMVSCRSNQKNPGIFQQYRQVVT